MNYLLPFWNYPISFSVTLVTGSCSCGNIPPPRGDRGGGAVALLRCVVIRDRAADAGRWRIHRPVTAGSVESDFKEADSNGGSMGV